MYIVFMLFKHAKNLEIQSYFGVNFTHFGGGLQTLRFLRLCFIDYGTAHSTSGPARDITGKQGEVHPQQKIDSTLD